MVVLGLTYRWCHTCQSAGGCSFLSASAAPWSSPPVGCPQSGDACSPGKSWRGSYIPGCSLPQGNLHRKENNICQPNKQYRVSCPPWTCENNACVLLFISLLPPKKSWLPVETRNEGLAWAEAPSSPSTATVTCPRLEISSTECHWPSFRAEPEDTCKQDTAYCTKRFRLSKF